MAAFIAIHAARSAAASSPRIICCTSGRSAMATGSSSPASVQSKASLRTAALPPTDVNTVRRLTPARSAMASIVVGTYPCSTKSSATGVDDPPPGGP